MFLISFTLLSSMLLSTTSMPAPHSNDPDHPHAYNPHANNPHAYNPHSHNPRREDPEPEVPLTAEGLAALHESGLELERAEEYYKAAKVFNRGVLLSDRAMKEPTMTDLSHAAEARAILELLTDFLSDLGRMFLHLREYGQASKVFHRTLEVTREVYDTSHPTYGLTLRHLGETHVSLQDYDEALRQFEALEKLLLEHVGIHHLSYGRMVTQIGSVYMAQGRMGKAASHFESFLAQVDSQDIALSLAYSKALAQDGQRDKGLKWAKASVAQAESALARVIEKGEKEEGEGEEKSEEVVELALCLNNLAGVTSLFNRLDEALGYLIRAKDLVDTSLGSDHPLNQYGQESIDQLLARMRPPNVVSNTEL